MRARGLLILILAEALSSCGPRGPVPDSSSDPAAAAAAQSAGSGEKGSWQIFRGDAGLSGVAAGGLPDSLSLRWTFRTGDEIKSSPAKLYRQHVYVIAAGCTVSDTIPDADNNLCIPAMRSLILQKATWTIIRFLVAMIIGISIEAGNCGGEDNQYNNNCYEHWHTSG